MNLQVKATFDFVNQKLIITDLIADSYNSVYHYPLSYVKGIFRISNDTGLLYQNAGWETNDFTAPDTENQTPVWVFDKVALLADSIGTYTIEYKVSVDNGQSVGFSSKFIAENDFVAPTPLIAVLYDPNNLTFNATDNTDYKINSNENVYNTTNDLSQAGRTFTIRYPLDSNQADIVSSDSKIDILPIWTGNYDIELSSDLTYNVDPSDNNLKLEFLAHIEGVPADPVVVHQKNYCLTQATKFLTSFTEQYEIAKTSNLREAKMLKEVLDDFMIYKSLYDMAIQSGTSTDYACTQMKKIMINCGFDMSDISDNLPIKLT